MRQAGVTALLALALGLGSPAAWAMGPPPAPAASVKAAYLSKFAAFVEWPEAAFPSPTSPVVLCVQGQDPFGPVLDQAVSGQRIGSRAMEVRRLDRVDRASGCQLLYLAGSKRQSTAEALRLVRGAPVLTVTDDERPGPQGIIHFTLRNNHVRFTIDADTAAQNRLSLSSKLLSVAISVRNRP